MAARLNRPRVVAVTREICGTYSGYQKHNRDNEAYCEPCKGANAERYRSQYATHPERERQRYKRNRQNPEYAQQRLKHERTRRALKNQVDSEPYSEADILHIYGIGCHICGETIDLKAPRRVGIEGWEYGLHLDHVIPIKAGGDDTTANVKPSHAVCNIRKSDSTDRQLSVL